MQRKSTSQTADLRTPVIYRERAFPISYSPANGFTKNSGSTHRKETSGLDIGSQSKLQNAAFLSLESGHPINTLITIRSNVYPNTALANQKDTGRHEQVAKLLESLRKWLTREKRKQPVKYIWCRESSELGGEHLHIGLHLNHDFLGQLIEFLARKLEEPALTSRRPISKRTRGEVACSIDENWHLAVEEVDGKPQYPGFWIASYIGKGEPSTVRYRRQKRNNHRKPIRGVPFGGCVKHDNYDLSQGRIVGNQFRKGRFGISRSLNQLILAERDVSEI